MKYYFTWWYVVVLCTEYVSGNRIFLVFNFLEIGILSILKEFLYHHAKWIIYVGSVNHLMFWTFKKILNIYT